MIGRRQFVQGACLLGAVSVLGAPPALADGKFRAAVEAELKKRKVPGICWAVIADGKVADSGAVGVKSSGSKAPLGAASRFQAASLSKTINALCVLTLVRDRLVGLDDPVNAYLKGWKLSGRKDTDSVTVRMLLSHTGGTNVHGFAGYDRSAQLPRLQDVLDGASPANSEAVRVEKKPGAGFSYSGGGTTVLQKLVQDVTGNDYVDAVRNRVLTALRMNDSAMRQPPLVSDLAFGHDRQGVTVWNGYHVYPEMAAAGLWTTAADMARAIVGIFGSLAGESGALLPRDMARQMVQAKHQGSGLGVFVDNAGRINHDGVNWGFRATYIANPAKRRGYVLMSNGENGEKLNETVARLILNMRGWKSV